MIGVFGGTFDPVHFGHLRPALELLQGLGLDQVRMIPCRQPPHREEPHATPEQRLEMLRLALAGVAGLVVDEREIEREGPSYMVDTLRSLREELGQTPLCLLLGSDAFAGLEGWHRWRELLQLAHIVIARRPGEELSLTGALAQIHQKHLVSDVQRLRSAPAGCLTHYAVTQLDISATRIRELVAAGESADFLLPAEVLRFIRRQGLYDGGSL